MVISTKGTTTGELLQGSTYVQSLVQTYTVVAASPLVLDRVISSLGLDTDANQLASQVKIDTPLNTVIIQIGVTDTDPKAAQDIANAIATELSSTVTELSPEAEDGTPAVRIETISRAVLPAYLSSPITAIGLLAGCPAATAEIADSNDVVAAGGRGGRGRRGGRRRRRRRRLRGERSQR